jgi:hypothetical protein
MAQQKVVKLGIKRDGGYLYYVDKDGDLARTPMARGQKKSSTRKLPEKVAKAGIKRENGWMYFLDKDGDISRSKMAGRTKSKSK